MERTMKKISMILAAASVVLAASSCDKGNESKTDVLVEPMVVNITADVMATKTVFNPSGLEDGASVPVLWEGDEILSIAVNENTEQEGFYLFPEVPPKAHLLEFLHQVLCIFEELSKSQQCLQVQPFLHLRLQHQ